MMRRVVVIGCVGSGKSTLARRLSGLLDAKLIHLDSFFWKPGWRETPRDEWTEVVRRLTRTESWVMDGNYGGTLDLRLATADAVIFLDFPRWLCLWRVVKRRLKYAGRSRPDMAQGCLERLDPAFLAYIWRYPTARRPGILEKLRQHSDAKKIVVLRSDAEVCRFLAELERSPDPAHPDG